MKKLFMAVLAVLSVFALASCGEKVMTADEIAKLDWKDFEGKWESSFSLTGAGDDDESDTETDEIEDADDFEKFAKGLKAMDEQVAGLSLLGSLAQAAGGSFTLSGDTAGYRYSKGSITREVTMVAKSADGKEEKTMKFQLTCKKTK